MNQDTEQTRTLLDILLVEDDPSDVRLLQEAFDGSEVPNQVHVTKNGEQAMAFLRRQGEFSEAPRPNVVILDLNMPRKGGHEVLAEIRADEDLKSLCVVVLTTSTNPDDRANAYEQLKADYYFNKLIDPDIFSEMVRPAEGFLSQFVGR